VKMGMNFEVPSNSGMFLSSCSNSGLTRKAQLYGVRYIYIYIYIYIITVSTERGELWVSDNFLLQ
jgi:hypothetical protein